MPKTTSILPNVKVHSLLRQAKDAEICRDLKELRRTLSFFWEDLNIEPDFSSYESLIRAELYRLCGVFVSLYGKAHNLRDFQIRAKDLLSRSIDLFEQAELNDKVAEANVMLALCYWNQGEIEESKIIIETVESQFRETPYHPVYLQIQINKLLVLYFENKNTESLQIIKKLSPLMELCADIKLKAMFHNQAGICFDIANRLTESVFHYSEAVRHSAKLENYLFTALNYNNLAMLYKKFGRFSDAHEAIDKSLEIFDKLNHEGFKAHALDTKAIILQEEGKLDESLRFIEFAIKIFSEGEDVSSLISSLWVKCQNLAFMNRKTEALEIYVELQNKASQKIGRIAKEKYQRLFADCLFFIKSGTLDESEKEFRKELVSSALRQTNGRSKEAAKLLGIDRGKMTNILTKQFDPQVFADDGYKKRVRLVSKLVKETKRKIKPEKDKKKISPKSEIAKILYKTLPCRFDFDLEEEIDIYMCFKDQMAIFGIDLDCVIAVRKNADFNEGEILLIRDKKDWILGAVDFDTEQCLFCVHTENGTIFLDSSNIVGQPIAYCEFTENLKIFNFKKFVI